MDTKTQNILDIKIKRLNENSTIPKYAKSGDAGLDLTAISKEVDVIEDKVIYGTGLALEIPQGYVGLLFPRSSIHKYDLRLANSIGVIDSGYRGEIKLIFRLTKLLKVGNLYEVGDRIGQLMILPHPIINLTEIDNLSHTERGETGFGSSGT